VCCDAPLPERLYVVVSPISDARAGEYRAHTASRFSETVGNWLGFEGNSP